jgi:hypothetical protein
MQRNKRGSVVSAKVAKIKRFGVDSTAGNELAHEKLYLLNEVGVAEVVHGRAFWASILLICSVTLYFFG